MAAAADLVDDSRASRVDHAAGTADPGSGPVSADSPPSSPVDQSQLLRNQQAVASAANEQS